MANRVEWTTEAGIRVAVEEHAAGWFYEFVGEPHVGPYPSKDEARAAMNSALAEL